MGSPTRAVADPPSSYPSSSVNSAIKPNTRSSYTKSFTSSLYIYPTSGHAVVVLGNSTGRSEPCGYVSRLLTVLVRGDKIPADLTTVLGEEVDEFRSQWETFARALDLGNRQCDPILQPDCTKIAGNNKNAEIGLVMKIHFCDGDLSASDSSVHDRCGSFLFSLLGVSQECNFLYGNMKIASYASFRRRMSLSG